MGNTVASAMQYEQTEVKANNKRVNKKLTSNTLENIGTGVIVMHLVKRHKFALLATFTITYLTFNWFGTLIVGLIQSLFN